jgi:hypothetical protein
VSPLPAKSANPSPDHHPRRQPIGATSPVEVQAVWLRTHGKISGIITGLELNGAKSGAKAFSLPIGGHQQPN